jgi:hypothetical protein
MPTQMEMDPQQILRFGLRGTNATGRFVENSQFAVSLEKQVVGTALEAGDYTTSLAATIGTTWHLSVVASKTLPSVRSRLPAEIALILLGLSDFTRRLSARSREAAEAD